MAPEDELSDEYVANLLKRDAAAGSARSRGSAPKPNTRFLQNILRDTSSHNAALLAKEREEARQRRERLARKSEGRLSPPEALGSHVRRSREEGSAKQETEREDQPKDKKKKKKKDRHRHSRSRSPRRQHDRQRDGSDNSDEELEKRKKRKRRHRDRSQSGERERRKHRRSSRSRSPKRKHRERSQSGERERRKHKRSSRSKSPKRKHRAKKDKKGLKEDSDPLETIVGAVQAGEPAVRMRGRGAFSSASKAAMDEHFKGQYDPSADAQPEASDGDDWDQALEAMRDRARWRAAGAERLRAAGFGDEAVANWEHGKRRQEGEGDVDDVRWSAKGSRREWDVGKVQILNAEEEGRLDVELRATFLGSLQKK